MKELWEITFIEAYEEENPPLVFNYEYGYDPFTSYVIKEANKKSKEYWFAKRRERIPPIEYNKVKREFCPTCKRQASPINECVCYRYKV